MPNEVLQPINIHLSNLEVGREYTTSFSIANTGLISTSTLLNPAVTGFSYTANNPTQNLSSLLIRNTDDVAVVVRVSTVDSEGHHYDKDLLLLAPDYYTQNCYAPPVYSVDVSDSSYVQSQDLVISTQDFTPPAQYEDINSDDIDPEVINFRVAASYSASNTETTNTPDPETETISILNSDWTQVGQTLDEMIGNKVSFSSDGMRVAIAHTKENRVRIFDWTGSEWTQVGQDITTNSDSMLWAVSLSGEGETVAIGQPKDSTNNFESGRVSIFHWSGTAWVFEKAFDGEAAAENLGSSVSLTSDHGSVNLGSGNNRLVIGATGHNSQRGRIRIFIANRSNPDRVADWTLEQDINGLRTGDLFGSSVAISDNGTRIAVGAPASDSNGEASGSVTVYYWQQFYGWRRLGNPINGAAASDGSGGYSQISISAAGNTVAIGARNHDTSSNTGQDAGHVRIYDFTGQWTQRGDDIHGENPRDQSGSSVSLSADGNTVAIGAIYNEGAYDQENRNLNLGHVRIFSWDGSEWSQVGTDIDGSWNGEFNLETGFSVSLSDDGQTVAIAGNSINAGTFSPVKVFHYGSSIPANWIKFAEPISGTNRNDLSMADIDLSKNPSGRWLIVLGEPTAMSQIGRVRVFEWLDTIYDVEYYRWNQSVINSDATNKEYFGTSVAIAYPIIAVGAPYSVINGENNSGSVTIFNRQQEGWTERAKIEGDGGEMVGRNVALSENGDILAVAGRGVLRIYRRLGFNWVWSQLGQDITNLASNGTYSLSISDDGYTIAVGDSGYSQTTVWYWDSEADSWLIKGRNIINGVAGDRSGWSVSLTGDGHTVAVGAPHANIIGSNVGCVRVFSWNRSDPPQLNRTWIQVGNTIAGEYSNDESGSSVSLSDDGKTVAIGAYQNDSHGSLSGHTRIYSYNDSSRLWEKIGADINGDRGDRLGTRVSLSEDGNMVAILSSRASEDGLSENGKVQLFEKTSIASTPAPTPDPEPDPTPDPEPDPTPDPELGPGTDPTPDPGPYPTPDPELGPGPDPTPDPEPDPEPDPAPEDGAEDTPSPSPEVPRGYIVNGVNNKTITLVRGRKYTFNLDIPGHPMYIQTSVAEGYDPQSAYVLHSSMNGKSVGDYTFTVSSDTPDTLWYQCRFHETMQGRILIVNPE